MRRSRGFRSRTRHKLKGGRFSIAEALQTFKNGAKVRIFLNPAVHSGMPHPRHQGRLGEVLESRGRSFVVGVKDGKLIKKFTCRPEHLRPEKIQKKTEKTEEKPKATKTPKPKTAKTTKPKAVKPKSQRAPRDTKNSNSLAPTVPKSQEKK